MSKATINKQKPADERPNAEKRKRPQCHATAQGTGQRCQRSVIAGSIYCRGHSGGAEQQTGIASRNFKHGERSLASPMQKTLAGHTRWAESVPDRLASAFHRSLQDDALLSLKPELALIDAMTAELIEGLGKEGYPTLFTKLGEALKQFEAGEATSNPAQMTSALGTMKRLINQGAVLSEQRSEIRESIKDRKSLVESERKFRIEQGLMVSILDVATTFQLFIGIIQRLVGDPELVAKIIGECERTVFSRMMPSYGATEGPVINVEGDVV